MNLAEDIPKFRECSGDKKYIKLTAEDFQSNEHAGVYGHLLKVSQRSGVPLADAKVLDFGCGRGGFVGYMRSKGLRAFGVEIDPQLVAAGAVLATTFQDEYPLAALVGQTGGAPFPDSYFDIISANQVFEHVEHLDAVASELQRLLRPGGVLLTLYPARFTLIEPHYHLPLVHWLPKGALQRNLIRLLVRAGLGVPPPAGMVRAKMGDVIAKYAEQETFYRSNAKIRSICAACGIELDDQLIPQQMLEQKLNRLSGGRRRAYAFLSAMLPLVGLRNLFKSCAVVGYKRAP